MLDKIKYFIRFAMYMLAMLFLLDRHVLPKSDVKNSVQGLEQPRLNL